MPAVLFSLLTFFSTLGGGLIALRFKERLHLILSFSAGVLLGVVSFGILPEIFGLAQKKGIEATGGMIAMVVGFLFFHGLEKFILVHHGRETEYSPHHHPHVGIVSAFVLAGHSFMDGVGIGLAFQVSKEVGIAVALAVIAHDVCDGFNTISLMLVHRNTTSRSLMMLLLDALAPLGGAASTLFFKVPDFLLMIYLGFFAGFLLYISIADILPEAHSRARPATALTLMGLTCLGAAFIFVVIRLAG